MRLHRTLIFVLLLNIVAAFVFFLVTVKFTNKYYVPLMQPFGWIFWLGISSFLTPMFVTREKAFAWFQEKYFWGSFILFALHVGFLVMIVQLIVLRYGVD